MSGGRGRCFAVGLLAVSAALSAVPAAAQTTCPQDTVRLTDGDIPSEGDVEYCRDNEWRSVCDDDWDGKDADVACRMAGYPLGAEGATTHSTFNTRRPVTFWLDNVACVGTEDALADCVRNDWGVHNCGLGERAGVRCQEQTHRNLVSNTRQTIPNIVRSLFLGDFDVAQGFTTGSHAQGYRLANLRLEFHNTLTTAPTVTLHKDGPNGALLATLAGPENVATLPGGHTFRAPPAVWLEPDTTYFVRAEGGLAIVQMVESTDEDAQGLPDWSIEDRVLSRLEHTTGGFGSRDGKPWEIQVNGSLAGDAAANATGAPAIAGPAQVGGTLRARIGDIADADGLPPGGGFPAGYALQWIRVETNDDVEIPGATSATYSPVFADENRTLKLRVRFFDGANVLETLTSAETNPVVPAAATCPALSVWCTQLTSGGRDVVGFNVGRGTLGAFGSLGDDTFTYGGTTYEVRLLAAANPSDIYVATTPDLPADGGGLTLHVQRVNGTLDLPLANGTLSFQGGFGGEAWHFGSVTGGNPNNPPLLRDVVPGNNRYKNETDPGTRITVRLSRQPGVSYQRLAHVAYEGGAGAQVSVTLTPPATATRTIPITATGLDGATSADWSGVPSTLVFAAGEHSKTFTVTAVEDSAEDAGERLELGFGTLPAGVPAGYLETATVHLFDPAGTGDVRLIGQAGVPTAGGEGRLEVFYRGEWGTVCDDRMDAADNIAPKLACQILGQGFEDGLLVDNGPYRLGDNDPTPIWLDDLRCHEGSNHWTDNPPTQLDHCYHAGIGLHNCDHGEDVALQCLDTDGQTSVDPPPPLRATLELDSNSHDGSAFAFRIAFTRDVAVTAEDMRDHALVVGGASVASAAMVDGRADLWEIAVEPAGTATVTVLVPFRACGEPGALCTSDGTALSQGASATIPYAPPPDDEDDEEEEEEEPAVPLTASFQAVPAEHGGAGGPAFRVELLFSEDVRVSNARMRTRFLQVSEGTLEDAARIDRRKDLWEFTVRPSSHRAVTLSLASGETCGEVICTFDGRPLSAPASAEIPGPPRLSVADAEIEEGPEARLAFGIELDRAVERTVTVEAATADGTAVAGEDYRAKTLAKTFEPGETRKVAVVRVLDDDAAEGPETMTLALSDAVGADIADGEATGTIVDGSVQNAVADGAAVYLVWPTLRDGFGTPSGTDYAVRVDGAARRVASASVSGRTARLALVSPVEPGEAVTVAYLGSAMHPLADASGRRSAPWEGLSADNVTGTGRGAPAHVEAGPRPADPRPAAEGVLRLDASGLGLADLSGNRIADPWPLAGLRALERLDLSGNRVADVGPLAGLSNLTVLLLDGTAVADVGPLAHLARLENLGLAGTPVSDVSALQDLSALRRLDLGGTRVPDPSPLGDIGTLVWLSLPGGAVGAPETLGRLTALRWVWSGAADAATPDAGAGRRPGR